MKFYQVAFVILIAILLYACEKSKPVAFRFTDISDATFGTGFELRDHHGVVRTLEDFDGKVVLVFFGYTECPDMCPTTLTNLTQVMDKLGQNSDQVQVLFVTLNPKADGLERLDQYISMFDPRFLSLTGTEAAIQKTANEFKVYLKATENQQTVEHSTGTYIFDQSGNLRLYARYGSSVDEFLHDINMLLKAS